MNCSVCGKPLLEGQGFASTVNAQGKALGKDEQHLFVCSEACKEAFVSTLPLHGKPLTHLARVTGYVQAVENWNKGKQQEFRDRVRYSVPGV